MRKYKIIAMCCVMMALLAGCQLARENLGANAAEDKLIGVFVTTQHLDLFDTEGYLNDNISRLHISGGEIIMDENTQKYQGRLYATLSDKRLTSEETGETLELAEYVFAGLEGIAYYCPTMIDAEHESYNSSVSDEGISDSQMNVQVGDDENGISMEGTIYVAPAHNMERSYYFNPVYQGADGSVYLTAGSGFMFGTWNYSEGEQFSQTSDASYTVTENGRKKTDSVSVKLSISVMFAPEKIVILQMGADSQLLTRNEYLPGKMPDSIKVQPGAAYLIVETHKRDSAGKIKLAREIYGRDDENLATFFARTDGVCVKRCTQIEWL